jgi:hypothetical protein
LYREQGLAARGYVFAFAAMKKKFHPAAWILRSRAKQRHKILPKKLAAGVKLA